jgi:hypothetical protein
MAVLASHYVGLNVEEETEKKVIDKDVGAAINWGRCTKY